MCWIPTTQTFLQFLPVTHFFLHLLLKHIPEHRHFSKNRILEMETLSSISYCCKRWEILKQQDWRIFSTWPIYCDGGRTDHFIQQTALLTDTWHLSPTTRWQDHLLLTSAMLQLLTVGWAHPAIGKGLWETALCCEHPGTKGASLTSFVGPGPSVWLIRVERHRTFWPLGWGALRHTNDNSSLFFRDNTVELICVIIFISK